MDIEADYVVTRTARDGLYLVHTTSCQVGPGESEAEALGAFKSCAPAVEKARALREGDVSGCALCAGDCYTAGELGPADDIGL